MPQYASSSGAKALQTRRVPAVPAGEAARLSAADIAVLSKARAARWHPGLSDQPLHSEVFASCDDASGAGVALSLARDALSVEGGREAGPLAEADDHRQVLWVQDARAIERSGRPYAQGLPNDLQDRLIHVAAKTPEDALFALEEGLKCRDLACVIGEVVGNPRSLDFTASRRLSLTAEKHRVALWLVRLEAEADLSSARMRWRVEAAPSAAPLWNHEAPGSPRWKAGLFRARAHAPGQWILNNDKGQLQAERSRTTATAANLNSGANSQPGEASPPYPRHLVRTTVGRSLAAVVRM